MRYLAFRLTRNSASNCFMFFGFYTNRTGLRFEVNPRNKNPLDYKTDKSIVIAKTLLLLSSRADLKVEG